MMTYKPFVPCGSYPAQKSLLVVIDGGKALHKAVVEVFGARACEHKQRNVSEALPERRRASLPTAINQAS
jgi:hypothetical protein